MYKLQSEYSVVRVNDGGVIPFDPENIDYKKYLAWIAEGNIPQGYSLEEVQTTKLAEIEAWHKAAITADIEYMGASFQSGTPSHDNIKSVISCGEVPNGFCWFDINNNPIPMTFPELLGFSKALVFRGFIAFARKQELKARVRVLSDVDAIKAITW